MTLSKFRSKSHKATKKRIKVSANGKILLNRTNKQHRMIGKSRSRTIKGKKLTIASTTLNKFRDII